MKNLILFLFSLVIILPASAYEITVERPPFNVRNSGGLEIEKIVLSDQNTTFLLQIIVNPENGSGLRVILIYV